MQKLIVMQSLWAMERRHSDGHERTLEENVGMIIAAGHDETIPVSAAEDLLAAAEEAGSPAELDVCDEATHAESLRDCPEDYPGWVLGFLERVLAPAG